MYIRNPETNEWEGVFLPPTGDTLPIGSEVEFDGDVVPTGWTEIDDLNAYSTNETLIGTWLGKPLYRKVYSTIMNGGQATIPIGLTNVSIKRMESLISLSENNNAFPGNVYRGDSATNQTCYIAGGNITFSTQYDRTGYELNVILEYTKNEEA